MHESSMRNMRAALAQFVSSPPKVVVDIGSYDVNGTYRSLFDVNQTYYVGVDMSAGPGVDVVLNNPYVFPIAANYADLVVSGQAFEHIEFFWLTWLEIVRITQPGGLIILIAPSRGPEHRYPVDCWRFYPDAYAALAKYAGVELLQSRTDWEAAPEADSAPWGDSVGVFRKPAVAVADAARPAV